MKGPPFHRVALLLFYRGAAAGFTNLAASIAVVSSTTSRRFRCLTSLVVSDRSRLLHDGLTPSALCRLRSMVCELHFARGLAQDSRQGRPQRRTVIIKAAMWIIDENRVTGWTKPFVIYGMSVTSGL